MQQWQAVLRWPYWRRVAIALGCVALVGAATNPSREGYVTYASTELAVRLRDRLCPQSSSQPNPNTKSSPVGQVRDLVAGACRTGLGLGLGLQRQTFRSWIDGNTQRQNYLFFSVYRTEAGDKPFTTVAIFGNYFTFP